MSLRAYTSADQPQIEAIQDESQVDIDPSVPEGFFDDLVNISEAFADGVFLIYEHAGEVAGFGGLTHTGEIVRMRIASKFRRKGFASIILRSLVDAARDKGFERVYLHTLVEQNAARSLYEHFGFAESNRGILHGNAVIQYEYNISSRGD